MRFKFDDYGWYDGTTEEVLPRTTELAPPTIPQARAVGEIYPCWGVNEWLLVPYVEPNVTPDPEPVEDPRLWWIDVGPFYDRFGADALAIAASDNGACKAVQTMTGVRKYIDLKDPRIGQMIDMLIALNQPTAAAWAPGSGPMTPAKKLAILTTPTTEQERHIKGL